MPLEISLLFLIFLVTKCHLFKYEPYDYCDPKLELCENPADHVMCQYPEEGLSRNCNGTYQPLSEEEKEAILVFHNKVRNKTAFGNLTTLKGKTPPASNVRQLYWDEELELLAQRWANQCSDVSSEDDHDLCRNTRRFRIFQNTAVNQVKTEDANVAGKSSTKLPFLWARQMVHFDPSVVDNYTEHEQDEELYEDETAEDFTGMIWADTYLIGCARVIFNQEIPDEEEDEEAYEYYYDDYDDQDEGDDENQIENYDEPKQEGQKRNKRQVNETEIESKSLWTFERLVCNYGPGGNVEGRPVFKRGIACGECPENTSCSKEFIGLCSKIESETRSTEPAVGEDPKLKNSSEVQGDISGIKPEGTPEKEWKTLNSSSVIQRVLGDNLESPEAPDTPGKSGSGFQEIQPIVSSEKTQPFQNKTELLTRNGTEFVENKTQPLGKISSAKNESRSPDVPKEGQSDIKSAASPGESSKENEQKPLAEVTSTKNKSHHSDVAGKLGSDVKSSVSPKNIPEKENETKSLPELSQTKNESRFYDVPEKSISDSEGSPLPFEKNSRENETKFFPKPSSPKNQSISSESPKKVVSEIEPSFPPKKVSPENGTQPVAEASPIKNESQSFERPKEAVFEPKPSGPPDNTREKENETKSVPEVPSTKNQTQLSDPKKVVSNIESPFPPEEIPKTVNETKPPPELSPTKNQSQSSGPPAPTSSNKKTPPASFKNINKKGNKTKPLTEILTQNQSKPADLPEKAVPDTKSSIPPKNVSGENKTEFSEVPEKIPKNEKESPDFREGSSTVKIGIESSVTTPDTIPQTEDDIILSKLTKLFVMEKNVNYIVNKGKYYDGLCVLFKFDKRKDMVVVHEDDAYEWLGRNGSAKKRWPRSKDGDACYCVRRSAGFKIHPDNIIFLISILFAHFYHLNIHGT